MTDSESLKYKTENKNLALHEPPQKLTSPHKPLQNVSNDLEYHSTESAKKNAGVIVDNLDTITIQTGRKEDSIDLDATLVMEDSCHREMKKALEPNSSTYNHTIKAIFIQLLYGYPVQQEFGKQLYHLENYLKPRQVQKLASSKPKGLQDLAKALGCSGYLGCLGNGQIPGDPGKL
ncbi:hypothetical protein BT96DRAFT_1056218, partial [Gymnopus androsaceus JB14]